MLQAGQRITKELLMRLYEVKMAGDELVMDAAVRPLLTPY
jgi:hypothetical protein